MSISLSINGKEIAPSEEAEIAQQINRRRSDGAPICVRIRLHLDGIDVGLGTPGCGGLGGGRMPNDREQRIIDLWHQLGLSDEKFTAGQVIAFLRQVRRFE